MWRVLCCAVLCFLRKAIPLASASIRFPARNLTASPASAVAAAAELRGSD